MSGGVLAADPTLSDFNQLIWWLVLLKVGIVFVFLLLTTIFMIWFERRVIGRMQNRPGPNRAGPWGLLQPIADALKLPLKEDIVPTTVDKLVFVVAPLLVVAPHRAVAQGRRATEYRAPPGVPTGKCAQSLRPALAYQR